MTELEAELEDLAQSRRDADAEMAFLTAAGRRWERARDRMLALYDAGKLAEAADTCNHGHGYPLASLAASHEDDPGKGRPGWRCLTCGSHLSGDPFGRDVDVVTPCELIPLDARPIPAPPSNLPLFSDWSDAPSKGKPYRVLRYRTSNAPGMYGWASSHEMYATEDEARAAVAAPMGRGVTEHVAHVALGTAGDWQWHQIVRRKRSK